ncbi:MAG: hypothetical protein KatS3mg119_1314 [Rhodothalassiaceae bacterium]|nr:MAG: hypothetical protein KatS3mg119_1314 [Rhodothalassiaceae bacterium]
MCNRFRKRDDLAGRVLCDLRFDALGRLERLIESGQDTRFLYDGAQVIGELDAASGAVKRRYVPGPGTNEVVAWYEGAGVGERRFIHQDERGSVVAVANGAGAAIAIFRYGPWGESSDTAPGSGAGTGFSRFGYTGAIRLPGTDLLHMRARVYATELARFLEPDPVGFASGQLDLYAYVGGDPINGVDPSGLVQESGPELEEILITGDPIRVWETMQRELFESLRRAALALGSYAPGVDFGAVGDIPSGEGEMMGEAQKGPCDIDPEIRRGLPEAVTFDLARQFGLAIRQERDSLNAFIGPGVGSRQAVFRLNQLLGEGRFGDFKRDFAGPFDFPGTFIRRAPADRLAAARAGNFHIGVVGFFAGFSLNDLLFFNDAVEALKGNPGGLLFGRPIDEDDRMDIRAGFLAAAAGCFSR